MEVILGSKGKKTKTHSLFYKAHKKVCGGKGGTADIVLVQDPKEYIIEKLLSGVFMNALVPV